MTRVILTVVEVWQNTPVKSKLGKFSFNKTLEHGKRRRRKGGGEVEEKLFASETQKHD